MKVRIFAAAALCTCMVVSGTGYAFAKENTNILKSIVQAGQENSGEAPATAKLLNERKFDKLVKKYARKNGVPEDLAHAVISVESNYNPKARGRAGEVGLMQIKPTTARMMGYSGSTRNLYDPETNIQFGMKYLAKAYDLGDGDTCKTILKYNAGHNAKRMNPTSRAYCGKVQRILN